MEISKQYDVLVEAIIRPARAEYDPAELGSPEVQLGNRLFRREDFELTNPRNLKFYCSLWAPVVRPQKLPCVIYCHGNGGCRMDAIDALRTLLPMNIMVVAFDFSGCGLSEGEYISLGYYEKEDIKVLVEHLRERELTTRIALWGRSMGAATALQYAATDPSLACIVCDSVFSSLQTLASELVGHFGIDVPGLMIKIVFNMVRNSVKKRAKFDIKKLDNVKAAQESFVPALFGHGDHDDFIAPTHTVTVQAAYAGDSNKVIFSGDHNSMRPPFFDSSVSIFIRNHLLMSSDFGNDNPLPKGATFEDYFATIGGGDTMKIMAPGRRIVVEDFDGDVEEATQQNGGVPPIVIRLPPGAETDEELLQRAIAESLKDANIDPELAAALALSAAESFKHDGSSAPVTPRSDAQSVDSKKDKKDKAKDTSLKPRDKDKKDKKKEKESAAPGPLKRQGSKDSSSSTRSKGDPSELLDESDPSSPRTSEEMSSKKSKDKKDKKKEKDAKPATLKKQGSKDSSSSTRSKVDPSELLDESDPSSPRTSEEMSSKKSKDMTKDKKKKDKASNSPSSPPVISVMSRDDTRSVELDLDESDDPELQAALLASQNEYAKEKDKSKKK